MKRIALVIDNAFLYAGTENICNFMSECFSGEGNLVDVISLRGEGEPFYSFSSVNKIITFNKHKIKLYKVLKFLRKNNYDKIYIISMGKLSVLFSIFMKVTFLESRKVICCEHVSLRSLSIPVQIMKFFTLRLYSQVIVLTSTDSSTLSKWKINNTIIQNPIFFKGVSKEGFNKKILAVGRLSTQKGFDKLIKMWSIFSEKHKGWILQIAGDGPEYNNLLKLIEDLQLKDSVILLGRVKNIDLLYRNSDIYLMTSIYEGLPLVLLEAKAWSLPVIAFDCPTGPAEIISNNIDGFLIENNNTAAFLDKLDQLVSNENLYIQLSRNCEVSHLPFSVDKISKLWINTLG